MHEHVRAVLTALPAPRSELVPLAEAHGRYLAATAVAPADYWPFDRAAMDGIAVRAQDVAEARPERPVALPVRGSVYAGDAVAASEPHCAMRIATGAPLPAGSDAVVPQELVRIDDGIARISRPVAAGKNVFLRGEDMRAGEPVLSAGIRLRGGHVAALAALGRPEVAVIRRVRVSIVACGDELVEPGAELVGGRIADTNTLMLAAEIEELGARAERAGIARDEPRAVRALLEAALGADAVVTCGGLSVGERDFVRATLRDLGARFLFEGAPIAPGSPAAVALAGTVPIFALPGTPGACRVAFEAFVRPALLAMLGAANTARPRIWSRLTERLDVRPGRTRFVWARSGYLAGTSCVTPLADQGTATIRSASDADALIVLGPAFATVEPGLAVETWLLDAPPSAPDASGPRAALGIVGPRNAGKTTLVERLLPALAARGVRAGAIKRHGHMRALDEAGKDTARAAAAGAAVTILTGDAGYVERRAARGLTLADALAALHGVDLALVEGYADSALAKVLVVRSGVATDRDPAAEPIVALVGDVAALDDAGGRPVFGWDEIERLAGYLIARLLGER
jgi:molybdopterin molybdotransferase